MSEKAIETLAQATGYLEGLINRERQTNYSYCRLDLEPIRALLDAVGRPQDGLSIIHVAGSKGKGSTCLFAESILMELGEHVGTFTSPHLVSWVERFRVDGVSVDESTLVSAVERVRPIVQALLAGPSETLPSFFDATTAVALLIFEHVGVDRVLLEVGLGGRLDSTNIVSPVVTCVTSIELEHTDKLGETEAEIAGEKAGILKPGVPAIVGWLRPEALRVVKARAAEVGAPIICMAESPQVALPELVSPGDAAAQNAVLALGCVRALGVYPEDELNAAAERGLSRCRLPGRIEVLEADPRVVVDGAHTAQSARLLAESLREIAPGGFELLISVSEDKQLESLLRPLLAEADRVWVTKADSTRSFPEDQLAKQVEALLSDLGRSVPIDTVPDPRVAATRARSELAEGKMLCATGSMYLAGVARDVLLPRPASIDG